jgi:hypothetical protein
MTINVHLTNRRQNNLHYDANKSEIFQLEKDSVEMVSAYTQEVNTLRTSDANLRFLHYNSERQITQICLLTHAWFFRT